MNWILSVFIILILFLFISAYRKKKKEKQLLNKLISNWGKIKEQDDFHFGSIEKYFNNNNQKEKAFHIISEQCANDLDVNETFKVIDRTSSKIGQQYLYYKIRTIENQERLLNFNELTHIFEENENLRLKVQLELSKINSNESFYFEELVTSKPVEKPKIIWLVYTLSFLSLFFIILGFLFVPLFLFLIPIIAVNMVFHYRNKWNVSNYLNGVNQLIKVLNISKNLARYPEIKNKFPDTTFINKIEKIKLKTAFISFEKNLNNELASLIWLVS